MKSFKKWLKNYMVPSDENNHHPHFWRDGSIAIVLLVLAVLQIFVVSQSRLLINRESFLASIIPGVLVSYTNDERKINNALPLTKSELLTHAAELKARDMATRGYFSHNTPEGLLPWHWIKQVGYEYEYAGENLAVNFSDSKDVVDAWMKSPTHRSNIVKQNYSEIGIALAEGQYKGKDAVFVVQFFGKPKNSQDQSTISTSSDQRTSTSSELGTPDNSPTLPEVAGAETDKVTQDISTTTEPTDKSPESSFTKATNKAFSSPVNTASKAFGLVLSVVVLMFAIILIKNRKIHHPRIVLMTLALIVIIVGLMYLNDTLLSQNVIVDEGSFVSTQE
jgi:hypothetical protein